MDKIKWKGSTLLAPVPPVLVSCGTEQDANALTIAWTGILNSDPPKTYISVRPERYSYDIIKNSGEFIINLPTTALAKAIDYCGIRSGRNENKIAAAKLKLQPCEGYECCMIEQSPINIACRVTEVVKLGTHDMFIADITDVYVAEELLDETGRLRMAKAGLCSFAHGEYFAQGRKIGSFGFSVKGKKAKKSKHKK